MALTAFQRRLCRLLADQRKAGGESYVAGGAALNHLLLAPRLSRDLDLFHDTEAALAATWPADRAALQAAGLSFRLVREAASFVQAEVSDGRETEILQWAQDSAYRFFPLVEDELLGLTLHPFDNATNKVLALVGRRAVRDWVDAIACHRALQPLGYLAWAACGKDPGLSPSSIVEQAARTRYAQVELDMLAFEGPPPDAADLSRCWHEAVGEARQLVQLLPAETAGSCVLDPQGLLLRTGPSDLPGALSRGSVSFRAGSIRGAYPELRLDLGRPPG
jgi:hypothetical protein